MPKVLGIVASPRKLGNCEIVAKEMARCLPADCEMQLLRLQDFNIEPCIACYRCLFGDQTCVLKDDLAELMEAVSSADALVVVSPTYFLGANAALKRIADRGLSFYSRIDQLWGKPAVGIGIAGIPDKEGRTLLDLRSFLKFLMADVRTVSMLFGALPGEVFEDPVNREKVASAAATLLGPAAVQSGPCCPLCGGDTFRFLSSARVQCMLCSNLGRIDLADGQTVFNIESGTHELFLTREDALHHADWLRGMRERFLDRRVTLKKITGLYRGGAVWIRPLKGQREDKDG